jgi:2-keto-myo-inositol isomerase
MKPSQLAINSVSTAGDSLEERLDACSAAGFRNVEFCLPHLKDYLKQGRTVADAARLLDRYKLRCIGGFEGCVTCFGDPRANDAVIANCRLLGELGATALVVGTDGPADVAKTRDPLGAMAKVFGGLGRRVKGTGVALCIEFNWSPIVKSLRTAVEIARRSRAGNVGVLFDPAHYHCTPTKFEMLTPEAVGCIQHVHVNDMNDKPAELSHCNSDRALPGAGHLDLRAIFGAIEKHGYRGWFSIEMFSDALWALPARAAARRMYRSLLPLCR